VSVLFHGKRAPMAYVDATTRPSPTTTACG
jgi:hypothetical protein